MNESIGLLTSTLVTAIGIYTFLLVIRIFLTWFPSVSWYDQPFSTLSQLTDPYLNIFRSIIPPLGGIDLSPMLAIFLLQIAGNIIRSLSPGVSFQ